MHPEYPPPPPTPTLRSLKERVGAPLPQLYISVKARCHCSTLKQVKRGGERAITVALREQRGCMQCTPNHVLPQAVGYIASTEIPLMPPTLRCYRRNPNSAVFLGTDRSKRDEAQSQYTPLAFLHGLAEASASSNMNDYTQHSNFQSVPPC